MKVDGDRYVTFTFDDGLLEGAWKTANLMKDSPGKATFYIVTGWVRPGQNRRIRDAYNRGRDHGSWFDWREIQSQGHEIGSHTVSHLNAGGRLARWFPPVLKREIRDSWVEIRRRLGEPPVSVAMPWNASTPRARQWVKRYYQTCRLGSGVPVYNPLEKIDWYGLQSWAPDSRVCAGEICKVISAIPAHHWLILQFHSLDGEGYMPIPADRLKRVLEFVARQPGLCQCTVREMWFEGRLRTSPDSAPGSGPDSIPPREQC